MSGCGLGLLAVAALVERGLYRAEGAGGQVVLGCSGPETKRNARTSSPALDVRLMTALQVLQVRSVSLICFLSIEQETASTTLLSAIPGAEGTCVGVT